MRTIKFRGYSAIRKEWLYGSLHVFEGVRMPSSPRTYIRAGQHNKDWHRVEPHSVGQYTGLDDAAGNEIFEGDIVELYFPNGNHSFEYVVFKNGRFITTDPLKPYRDDALYLYLDYIHVVGNIYDSPEFLKPNSNATTL